MTGRFSVEYSPEEDDWSSVCGADVALVEKGRILAKSTESGTVSQLNQPLITEHQPPGCRSKAAKAALPLVFEFHCFFHRNLSLSGFKSRRTSCSQTHWCGKNKQQWAETCRLSEVTVRQTSLNTVGFMFEYFVITSLSLCRVLLITISLSPSLSTWRPISLQPVVPAPASAPLWPNNQLKDLFVWL